MDNIDVLRSATSIAARAIVAQTASARSSGLEADLLVVDGDP